MIKKWWLVVLFLGLTTTLFAQGTVIATRLLVNGVYVYTGSASPTITVPDGTWYLRTNGQLWTRLGGAWVQFVPGSGTVTSVALTAPAIFSVAGSPVTTTGTLALSLASQTANNVFASPNGSSGTPVFRKVVFGDW